MSTVTRTEPFRVLVCDGCGITCGEEPEAAGILRVFDEGVDPWDYDYPEELGWIRGWSIDPPLDGDYCSRCYEPPFDDPRITPAKPGWWTQ